MDLISEKTAVQFGLSLETEPYTQMYKETVEWIPIYSDYKNLLIIRFTSVPLWRTTVWRFLKKTGNRTAL